MTQTPEQERDFWNRASRINIWGEDGEEAWDHGVAACLGRAIPHLHLNRGHTVLDLGCGIGRLTLPAAKLYPDVRFVGIDISTALIDEAEKSRHELAITNARFESCDGRLLPADVEGAHAVYSVLLFQHLPPEAVRSYIEQVAVALVATGRFRFQYVEGTHAEAPFSYAYRISQIRGWLEQAGLQVEMVDAGQIYPEWTWVTAVKP